MDIHERADFENTDPIIQPEIMMPEKHKPFRPLRRLAHVHGASLLGYKVIMNLSVYAVAIVAGVIWGVSFAMGNGDLSDMNEIIESITALITDITGWGYLLAIAIGYLVLRIWKRKMFTREVIYKKTNSMKPGTFLVLVCLVFGLQIPAELLFMGMEFLLNLLGLSLAKVVESNGMNLDNFSMWLYVCLLGPITEELIFRGFLLRSTERYGKRFAVLSSALLFGLFHGSPIQTPYAFLVGLVLGYVALEYHIGWAVLLHIMNNMLLSDTLPRLLSLIPGNWADPVMWVFLSICFVAAVVVLIVKRWDIRRWKYSDSITSWQNEDYWFSPLIILLIILCLMDIGTYFLLTLFTI